MNDDDHNSEEITRRIRDLRYAEPEVRDRATQALLAIGPPAVPALIEALSGNSFLTRIRAAKILGEIADPRAIVPMIRAWHQIGVTDSDSSAAIATGLVRLIEQNRAAPELAHAQRLLERLPAQSWLAERIRAALGPTPNVPPTPEQQASYLVRQLQQAFADSAAEEDTVRALIALGATAVPPLIDALRWSNAAAVREIVARTLCALGDVRAVGPILSAIKDETELATRQKMMHHLRAMKLPGNAGADPVFTRPLIAALNAESAGVTRLAAEMLVAAGPPAAPALVSSLGDATGSIRRGAALILGRIAVPETAPALRKTCSDPNPNVRYAAVAALGRLGAVQRTDIPLLTEALRDNSQDSAFVRTNAARALGGLAAKGSPAPELRSALNALRRLARSPLAPSDVRDAAKNAIQTIESATAALKDLPMPASAAVLGASTEGLPVPASPPVDLSSAGLPLPVATTDVPEGAKDVGRPTWWQRVRRLFVRL